MYAIIKTGGKQYKVTEGDVIRVEKLEAEEGSTVTFDEVLMVSAEGELKVGEPTVDGASVTATVNGNGRGKKVLVFKYKPKKTYKKTQGHRQTYTEVKIDKINA